MGRQLENKGDNKQESWELLADNQLVRMTPSAIEVEDTTLHA